MKLRNIDLEKVGKFFSKKELTINLSEVTLPLASFLASQEPADQWRALAFLSIANQTIIDAYHCASMMG